MLVYGDSFGNIVSYEVDRKRKRHLKKINSSIRKIHINSSRNFVSVYHNREIDIWYFDERTDSYKRAVEKQSFNLYKMNGIEFHPNEQKIYIDDDSGNLLIYNYELDELGLLQAK